MDMRSSALRGASGGLGNRRGHSGTLTCTLITLAARPRVSPGHNLRHTRERYGPFYRRPSASLRLGRRLGDLFAELDADEQCAVVVLLTRHKEAFAGLGGDLK